MKTLSIKTIATAVIVAATAFVSTVHANYTQSERDQYVLAAMTTLVSHKGLSAEALSAWHVSCSIDPQGTSAYCNARKPNDAVAMYCVLDSGSKVCGVRDATGGIFEGDHSEGSRY